MNYEIEEKILFQRYGIRGYDTDAPGLRGGATLTFVYDDYYGDDEGLVGDTDGHIGNPHTC